MGISEQKFAVKSTCYVISLFVAEAFNIIADDFLGPNSVKQNQSPDPSCAS